MHDPLHTAILSTYPQAAEIVDIQSYRPDYLPYPARVTLRTDTGPPVICALKVSEVPDRLSHEACVLRALSDLHLPVPQVLGGPVTTRNANDQLVILLLSELPGQPLPWVGLTDLATAHRTCQLLQEAIDTLHALTPRIKAHPISSILPSITLENELQTIITRGGPWFDIPVFTEAITLLQTTIPRYTIPLVFSNGDYNPLNILAADNAITGWIDFEHACFEDPYIGFAKFVLWADDEYGWGAGARVGLVERYLYEHQVAPVAFLVRLLLRGIWHIQSIHPVDPSHYMVHVVTDTVSRFRQALS